MRNKGFTLIELVLSVFIITVALSGAFTILQKVVASTTLSSSQLIASFLAQEGIDIVRNIRDTNFLAGSNWLLNGLNGCSSDCEADYNDNALVLSQDRYLRVDGNFFNYDSGTYTKFKRKIKIIDDPLYGRIIVTVRVQWKDSGRNYEFSAQTELYNWKL